MMSVQINNIAMTDSGNAQIDGLRASPIALAPSSVSGAAGITTAAPAATSPQATEQDLQRAVDTLNEHYAGVRDDLRFSVAHDLGMPVISVVDAHTGEVVWQVPTEQALEAARQVSVNGHLLQVKA